MKQTLLLVLALLAGALALDDNLAFLHNNNRYAVLDDVAWNAPFTAATLAVKPCNSVNFVPIPQGWELAPNDEETRFVIQNTVFGTFYLILADGTGWQAGKRGVWSPPIRSALISDTPLTGYHVVDCEMRILLKATGPGSSTQKSYPYVPITNFVVFKKFKFATIDNIAPDGSGPCSDLNLYTVPPGWQLASQNTVDPDGNPGPDPRVPIGMFNWGSYLLVLEDGTGWIAGQSSSTPTATSTLVKDNNGFRAFCSSRVFIYALASQDEQKKDIVINSASDFKFLNSFVFEGFEYAAADDTHYLTKTIGCQDKWIQLPLISEAAQTTLPSLTGSQDGGAGATTGKWEVAPYDITTKAAVIGAGMQFGAVCLSLKTKAINTVTATDCDQDPAFTGILSYTTPDGLSNYYKPNGCSRRVLLRRTTAVTVTQWPYGAAVTNKFTFYDKEFATIDNTVPGVAGVGGCTDKSFRLDKNWELCNTSSPLLKEAMSYYIQTYKQAVFGTVCLALSNGGLSAGNGDFTTDCNKNWLLTQTIGLNTYISSSFCSVRPLLCRSRTDTSASNVNYLIKMKILVLSVYDNTADDPRLGPILAAVRGFGIPYDHYIAYNKTAGACKYDGYPTLVTADGVAQYYAIIMSTYGMQHFPATGQGVDCITSEFRQALNAYKVKYNVRLYSAYTVPVSTLNLATTGSETSSVYIKFDVNATGAAGYTAGLNPAAVFPLANGEAFRYPSVVYDSNLALKYKNVIPVMRFVNSPTAVANANFPMAMAVVRLPDGSDELHTFVDSSENMFHGQAFGTIYINWLTKGIYQGFRRNYFGIQIDDVFSATENWNASCPCKGHIPYRITGADLTALSAWQADFNTKKTGQLYANSLVIEHAVNCYGLYTGEEEPIYNVTAASLIKSDTLLAYSVANIQKYFWVSHTWSHLDQTCPVSDCATTIYNYYPSASQCNDTMAAEYLNGCYRVPVWGRGYYSLNTLQFEPELSLKATSYELINLELSRNNLEVTTRLIPTASNRKYYSRRSLINPRISGLFNPNAVKAMYDNDIRYIVGDSSRTELWPYPMELNGGPDRSDWPPTGYNVPLSAETLKINWYHARWLTAEINGYRDDTKYWRQILMISRFPTNIYYDSSSKLEMQSEYNFFYGPTGILSQSFPVPRTADEILASEAERVTKTLLVYRWDPYMFHQVNLRAFTTVVNGNNVIRCMVGLWVEAVYNLFSRFSTLPLVSLKQDDLGDMYVERMERELDCKIETVMSVRQGMVNSFTVTPKNKSPNGCIVRFTGPIFKSTSITIPTTATNKAFETYGPDFNLKFMLPVTYIGEANLPGGYPPAPLPVADKSSEVILSVPSTIKFKWSFK